MRKDIPITKLQFKGVAAVIASIAIAVGAYFYNDSRRASLERDGREQVEEYLSTELVARKFRERGKSASARELERQKDFEIVEFSTPFVPRDRARVRVRVRTPDEEIEYHFRFERLLGEWRLRGESRGGLFR